jgi:hypothetical protein
VNTKQCRACREVKSVTDFHRYSRSKDGLKPICKPCNVAAAKSYVQRNAEKVAAYQAEWSKRHPEKRREHIRNWAARNPERAKELARERATRHAGSETKRAWIAANRALIRGIKARWKAGNKDAVAADAARRRANELRAMPPWADQAAIGAVYAEAARLGLSVDHIVPLRSKIVCGLHYAANLRLIPLLDNIAKGNRHWPDMP